MTLHMTSYISVFMLTMRTGNFKITAVHRNVDGHPTSAMVSDEDRMSACMSVIVLMLGSSLVHMYSSMLSA